MGREAQGLRPSKVKSQKKRAKSSAASNGQKEIRQKEIKN
jgi:hypothetical protein